MTRFVDQATIRVEAGHGGKGCRSFYQDLWNRYPIPDGGDGGCGGRVVARADPQLTTLLDFETKRHFRAGSGGHGSSKRQRGASGRDCVVHVPLGTLVFDDETGDLLREILRPGDDLVVARGGAGGIGNGVRARSRSGEAPRRFYENSLEGAPGEKRRIRLELKLIADVGIVGMPNAGKSTLIGRISGARPKVAPFPFTTLHPVLGVVDLPKERRMVAVDLPGLIAGAHAGKGLGLDFLRHIERTRFLIHLIDMAAMDGRDPAADYKTLNRELKAYHPALVKKPQIVAANKMDQPQAKKNLVRFLKRVKTALIPISAMTGEGVQELLEAVSRRMKNVEEA